VPLAVVIWNNTGYGEIKAYMRDRQIPEIGVDIYTPDFITIAQGLGCHAVRPADIAALRSELAQSAKRKVPTIIEIRSGDPLARELAA
jgi:acetolactate synthase-1/2/3 large subunit